MAGRILCSVLSLTIVIGLLVALPARADVTRDDVVTAARALSFMNHPPTGEVIVGIVVAPRSAESAAEARSIAEIIGSGLKVGNMTLRAVTLPLNDLGRANVQFFFMTHGIDPIEAMQVAAAGKGKGKPCVTGDIAQVERGACVVGVRSAPKIEILVNRAAAASSDITFASTFRMMITEF